MGVMQKIANLTTPKRFEQYKCWIPTVGIYGATAVTTLIYFIDITAIVSNIPIYGSKFK